MKRRKPKPVVLEPAHVGLARLGREMGSNDVPAAELVASLLWSAEASREVDRIVGDAEREFFDQVDEDMQRGIVFSRRCMSCGATCAAFGVKHANDCDLDRSLSAQQRYELRNPGHKKRQFRIMAIKARWAFIHGRCVTCWRRPRNGDGWRCAECAERVNARIRRHRSASVETARAA